MAGIHWFAPASAIVSLIVGSLLAIGHHLFYESLHNTPVFDGAFLKFDVSQQQVNIAIGTTFAFLVRACMVVAISIAFIQVFWHATSSRTPKAAPTLKGVDAVYSTLENAFEMFNLRSWLDYPLLMLIAGLAWLVPIASIITPATLSVRTSKVSPSPISSVQVPTLAFTNMKYLAQMPNTQLPSVGNYQGPSPDYYAYAGASDEVLRISNAVMGDGAILPITPPGTNASWQLEFYGPSLECNDVDRAQAMKFVQDFVEHLQRTDFAGTGSQHGFVAWFPDRDSRDVRVPFTYTASNRTHNADSTEIDLGSLVPHASDASLNRSSLPLEMMILTKTFEEGDSYDPTMDPALGLRRCQLFNATYSVSFDYSGGIQKINSSTTRNQADGPVRHIPGALYRYMDQLTDEYLYPCSGPNAEKLRCCYNHSSLRQTLAYQSIMDAFTQRFLGVVYMDVVKYPGLGTAGAGLGFFVNSSILQTRLAQSKDLQYLWTTLLVEPKHTGRITFQAALNTNNDTVIANGDFTHVNDSGIYDTSAASDVLDKPLGDVIEEVFRNFTVSLMSSTALQPNYSSLDAPSPVAVTHELYHNIYTYSAQKLWLPYGIALALTALAVIVGLVTMYLNKASYGSNFSTVLRAAHGAQLSTQMREEDMHGQDPLPKYLKDAKIWLQGVGSGAAFNGTREVASVEPGPSKVPRSSVRLLSREESSPQSYSRSRSRGRI